MQQTVFERLAPPAHIIDEALADTVLRPFWLDDVAQARAEHPPLAAPVDADLAIVGGGYLGLWSAILAKERDPALDVALLEAGRLGGAASGRNGGFCEASLTHGPENGRVRWPEEFERLQALGLRNLDEIEATLKRYDIDCALLHPGKLAAGLARVAAQLGVQIFERSPVLSVSEAGERLHVAAAGALVSARRVILATNAFASLLGRYRRHTLPVYDYVLMTAPLSPAQMASVGWRHRQGVADMANQFHYYR